MKILKFATYEEMSAAAADILAKQINIKSDSVLGLATGSTPVGMYKKLVEMNKSGLVDFSKIKTVNLDEYYPIDPANKQSYRYFMDDNLFNHVNIDKANTYVPDGAAEDADLACENHEKIIKSLGGIDVQILGIGQNGHIGFNEPEENLTLSTHKTALTENTDCGVICVSAAVNVLMSVFRVLWNLPEDPEPPTIFLKRPTGINCTTAITADLHYQAANRFFNRIFRQLF